MRFSYKDTPIQFKLMMMVLLVGTVTFFIASGLIAVFTRSTFQDKTRDDMVAITRILGDNSVIPIQDKNEHDALEVLASLRVKESIEYACVYTNDGLLAPYIRDPNPLSPSRLPAAREGRGYAYTDDGKLVMWQAIVREGETLGSIVLQSDLSELHDLFRQIYTVMFLSFFLSLGLGYILAKEIQIALMRPIISLSKTAKKVSEEKDFSMRAKKYSNDEVGVLTSAFNDMLGEIQISNTALQESQERYRSFVQNSSEATFRIDYHTPISMNASIDDQLVMHRERAAIVQSNQAFRRLYGFSESEPITFAMIDGLFDEEIIRAALSQDLPTINIETYMDAGDRDEKVLLASVVRTIEQGALSRMWITQRDVTELRNAEEEQDNLQRQLIQVQKMDSVGQLAGGIAHDFNNILVAILGYTELAQGLDEEASLPEPMSTYHREIEQSANRAAALTRQLLAFSRRQIMELKSVDLNEMLRNLEHMLARLIPKTIYVEFFPAKDQVIVRADLMQLEQVVINMAVNARDSMLAGGRLTFRVTKRSFEQAYVEVNPWARAGDFAVIEIEDTGCGMSDEVQGKIFEPFFTTKPMDKGTGLGMSVALGIIEQHQGFIQVYSEVDMGSDVEIYIPLVNEDVQPSVPEPSQSVEGGTETILLVEDEDQVRNIARMILERAGYTVIEAKDGEEGLALFHAHADSIQLLVMDVVMPKMGGEEVMKALRQQGVTTPIIFTSGYSGGGIHDGFILEEGYEFLPKPYNRKDLQQKVREVLDR